jgi:hypothetical protein
MFKNECSEEARVENQRVPILFVDNEFVTIDADNVSLKTVQLKQVESNMAFVNEFASDEDIEKYDLNGVWNKYHPLRKGKFYLGQRPWFTIDRDRNIFFMIIGGSRDEPTRKKALIWIDGQHVVVEIDLAKGCSPNIKDVPYKIIWDLVGVRPQLDINKTQNEIIGILKEALTVYGHFGVHMQVPNTIVGFNF